MVPVTVSPGWLWEMCSAIVARVRDRSPMEVSDDLGHSVNGNYLGGADKSGAIGKNSLAKALSTAVPHRQTTALLAWITETRRTTITVNGSR